ncbi:MAG: branched-chain amino acid ABC transporter permease [Oscillospiraceae bacterium]|nr:branched-chain amino acid ABC transporter permease [Oscillospiraceae bacterium]
MEKNKAISLLLKDPRTRYVIIGVLVATIPFLATAGLLRSAVVILIGSILIYSVAGLGINILLGYSGLISLGTAGFMGFAAYIAAYLTMNLGFPFEITLLISIAVPVLLGLFVGLVSFRIEGIYLAIATLSVGEVLRRSFEELVGFTNSFAGMRVNYPTLFGVWSLDRNGTFVLIAVALTLAMILTHNIVHSRPGRALHAMRGSTVAAQAMGVNILRYRLFAFAVSTGLVALAGVLYVHFVRFTHPDIWGWGLSLNILALVIIGGLRSIYGTLLGAFVVFGIPSLILVRLPIIGDIPGVSFVFNGIVIVIVVLLYPRGIVSIFTDIGKLIKKTGRA